MHIYIIIIIYLYNTSTNAEMYERGGGPPPHNQEGCFGFLIAQTFLFSFKNPEPICQVL